MHQITSTKEISELLLTTVPVSLTLRDQFVLILRDGDRSLVFKNIQGRLSAECFPSEAAWPDGVPVVNGLTILVEEKGKADSLIRSYKVLLRLQLTNATEQIWLVGDDKEEKAFQLFTAYESSKTATVETVIVVEGDGKKPKSCGALSFDKQSKKALNTFVKVVKALMGLSGINLTPMLDGDTPSMLSGGRGNDVVYETEEVVNNDQCS